MRLNSKILYAIISLAFVGGMFTSVYAGPILPTITLAGNVHTTGDSVVDGDLSVGGVSFAALDSRIAALETTTVPMVLANEAMITTQGNTLTTQGNTLTTHDSTLTTHDSTLTTQGNMLTTQGNTLTTHDGMIISNAADIATNDAMISSNQADIATNGVAITSLEEGNPPPQSNPCDPDGDGSYTAQEIVDHIVSNGGDPNSFTLQNVSNLIQNVELSVGSPVNNILDTAAEKNEFNGSVLIPLGYPSCPT